MGIFLLTYTQYAHKVKVFSRHIKDTRKYILKRIYI